jgi:hypothetical protein
MVAGALITLQIVSKLVVVEWLQMVEGLHCPFCYYHQCCVHK